MSEDQIAALLHERERHVDAGRTERVADIDAELEALGHRVKATARVETADAAPAPETADAPRARGRR